MKHFILHRASGVAVVGLYKVDTATYHSTNSKFNGDPLMDETRAYQSECYRSCVSEAAGITSHAEWGSNLEPLRPIKYSAQNWQQIILYDLLNFFDFSRLRVRLTGNILTDWLVNPVITVFVRIFDNVIMKVVQSNIRSAVQDAITIINANVKDVIRFIESFN